MNYPNTNKSKININNLNIASLFPCSDGSKNYVSGCLDIKTLFASQNENYIFDSRVLLNQKNQRDQVVLKWYRIMYKSCCEKIKDVNDNSITDIIFDIVVQVAECPEYDSYTCLKFIEKNLNEQFINTHILSATKIFISWNNLENKYDTLNKK